MVEPTANDIRRLRERHGLTQAALADSLYGVKRARIPNWEGDRRRCPSAIFWAMVMIWDEMDLRREEEDWRLLFRGPDALG